MSSRKSNGNKNKLIMNRILAVIIAAVLFFLSPAAFQTAVNKGNFGDEIQKQFYEIQNFVQEVFHTVKDSPYEGMSVHYIDVGQGDATLIQVNGMNMLIDTGESDQSEKLTKYLIDEGVKKIDIFLITHPHSDHMGAASSIIEQFPIDKLYMTNYVHTTKTYEKLLKTIKSQGLKIQRAKKGVELELGADTKAYFLAPDKNYEDINASSAVLKVEYGRTGFLFGGDATTETERDIMNHYPKGVLTDPLSVNVYKVAHHGSNTSNSMKYLERLSADICIISLGKNNSYGHPHKEVMNRLKKLNVKIQRTDELGTIVVRSDGEQVFIL